jgi:hypothetical protein
MNDNIKKQIVALIEGVKAKDPKATQIMQDIMNKAQQGDRDAIALANAIQEVIKEMNGGAQQQQQPQGPVAAKFGAKLNYIRTIRGGCPEGQQLVYFKQGGRVCKKCVEAAGGAKVKDGKKEISDFKKKKACGGSKMKFELGGEAPKKPAKKEEKKVEKKEAPKRLDPRTTTTLPGGKYPTYWTSQQRQLWERLHGDNDEGAGVVENKGIGKNCKGGKAKKHFFGGVLGF